MIKQRCRQCGRPDPIGPDGLCGNCRELKKHPDPTSFRTRLGGVPFFDMKQTDEQDRFKLIAQMLVTYPGKEIGVMVDIGEGDEDKGDRYIRNIRELVPNVQVVKRGPGPVPKSELITLKL